MTPPSVSKEERREQIIRAAVACFARKGYHLTTMDDIVAESGLSKGSLYWHFKNKKDLLIKVMGWYFDQMAAEAEPMLAQIPDSGEQLKMLLLMFSQVMASDDPLLKIFIDFYAETRNDPDVHDALRQMMEPYFRLIGDIIRQGIDDGKLKPVNPRQMAASLMAAFDGMFLYKMMLGDMFDWQATAQQFSDVVLAGLQAEKK